MAVEPLDEHPAPITPAPATRTSDLWWKNGVIYCLDVEKFMDGNGDGVGDFVGLTQKVDYLAGLGVTCLWLMPFYASPNRDDGYDVSDYYAIDPRLGTFGDFVDFMRTAHDRGLRVIAELVVNHTSEEHLWFRAARDRRSPLHDFYVWQDEKPAEEPTDIIFPDAESSVWAWDERCGALVSAPVLLIPAGPQRRKPARKGRDPEDRELLAAARCRRVPRRRGAVPGRHDGAWRATRTRTPSTGSVSCAPTSSGATAPAS